MAQAGNNYSIQFLIIILILNLRAIAAVEAMSDRVCIHSHSKDHFRFSSQHLISCCHTCGFDCGGGFPGSAWSYWVRVGLVRYETLIN